MTSVAELSNDTQELLERAVNESDELSPSDSLDSTIQHLCRSLVIRERAEELGEGGGEPSTEAREKQAELREQIMENI